jgi:hypothetical protein
MDQVLIGRHEAQGALANILLQHRQSGQDDCAATTATNAAAKIDLTRRISARHAVIRLTDQHFEIEDISRFGLLIDGKWPGKGKAVVLKSGMQLDFTASFKGIATLLVQAVSRHALVLQSRDLTECFYCLVPELGITARPANWPHNLPLLYHQYGGFWHWDQDSHKACALGHASSLSGLQGLNGPYHFQHGGHLAAFASAPSPEPSPLSLSPGMTKAPPGANAIQSGN